MKILISSSTYAPARNGQAVFTTNLAEGMVQRGHTVWVIIPSSQAPAQSERNGVHIQTVRALDLGFLHNEAYAAAFPQAEVRRFFQQFQPDLVHLQDHHPLSICVQKEARRLRRGVMGTNHFMPENLAPYFPMPSFVRPVFTFALWEWMKWTFNSIDLATAPSRTAAGIMRQQGVRTPIIPISCGVDLSIFHPEPSVDRQALRQRYGLHPTQPAFLFVGRVDGEKRLDVLIRAVQALGRTDFQLVIAGRGAALPDYQALARELGVAEQVRFTGFIPDADLVPLLNSVEFFTMPSEAELLSIASLEAMGCGRPLLVARARALPELVSEGVNGCLFEPGDALDAARGMAWLLDHPDRWASLSAASLSRVQPHGLENVIKRYEDLYFRCAAGLIPQRPRKPLTRGARAWYTGPRS